jgi:hypothetical protein
MAGHLITISIYDDGKTGLKRVSNKKQCNSKDKDIEKFIIISNFENRVQRAYVWIK